MRDIISVFFVKSNIQNPLQFVQNVEKRLELLLVVLGRIKSKWNFDVLVVDISTVTVTVCAVVQMKKLTLKDQENHFNVKFLKDYGFCIQGS